MNSPQSTFLSVISDLPEEERHAFLGELLRQEAARAEMGHARHETLHFMAALVALEAEHEPSACPLLATTLDPEVLAHRIKLLANMDEGA